MALEPTAAPALEDEKLIDQDLQEADLLDNLNNTELETLINDEELDLSLEAEEVENPVVSDKKATEPEKLKLRM